MYQHLSCLCVIAQIHLHQPRSFKLGYYYILYGGQVTLMGVGDSARTREVILSPVAVLHDSCNNREMDMLKQ